VNKLILALPLLFVSSAALADPAVGPAASTPTPPAFEPMDASLGAVTAPAADEPATLAGSRGLITHNGWYVAPSIGATTLDGHLSSLVGVRGGWLINRQFGIGLAGNAFGWDTTHIDTPRPNTRVDGGYGGLLLQYIIASDKLVHGNIETTIGGGALCYDAVSNRRDCNDAITFFVFEPTANLELNVTSFMRIAVGGGYRFTAVEETSTSYKPELSGFVTRTSIKFGQF
jgi:hypothetical protein